MQITRNKIRSFLVYVVLVLLIIRLVTVPSYQKLSENREIWQNLVKAYETMISMKENRGKRGIENLDSASLPYFTENTPLVYAILLGVIRNLVQKRELQLLHYEVLDIKREGKIEFVPLQVKMKGRPEQLFPFLMELSRHPKVIYVLSLEILDTGQGYEMILNIAGLRYLSGDSTTNATASVKDK